MRIVVLTSLYPTSVRPREGLFAERRWLAMRDRGHEVRVVQPLPWAPLTLGRKDWEELRRTPASETRGGIEVVRPRYVHLPGRARGNARRFAAAGMKVALGNGRPDALVADYAWPASAAAPLCERERLACIVNGRGSDVLQVAGEAGLASELAANLRAAGHWCAVSQDLVDRMDELGQAKTGVLVANGVDGELFRPREQSACRRALGQGDGELVLVVGHLIERKDPLLALEAFAELARMRRGARLVFVGRGPLHEALVARIAELGLGERVVLAGEADPERLAQWYGAADVLLLTSRREGRPNVVLEALSSGLPVLATNAGGTAELLAGLDGTLLETRDPDAIAAALNARLAQPRDAELLRAHARTFSWSVGLDALEALLERARRSVRR